MAYQAEEWTQKPLGVPGARFCPRLGAMSRCRGRVTGNWSWADLGCGAEAKHGKSSLKMMGFLNQPGKSW